MVTLSELYREFEKIDLGLIRANHIDNGILRGFIEKCDDDYRRQFAQHLIRVNEIEIENVMEEIIYDRSTAKEFEKL